MSISSSRVRFVPHNQLGMMPISYARGTIGRADSLCPSNANRMMSTISTTILKVLQCLCMQLFLRIVRQSQCHVFICRKQRKLCLYLFMLICWVSVSIIVLGLLIQTPTPPSLSSSTTIKSTTSYSLFKRGSGKPSPANTLLMKPPIIWRHSKN